MNKLIIIAMLASIGLACIIGCPSTDHKTQGIPPAENTKSSSGKIQANKVDPNKNPVQKTQTKVSEPNQPVEAKQEPNEPLIVRTEPNEPNESQITKTDRKEPNEPNESQISKTDQNEPNDSNLPQQIDFHEKCAHILTTYVDAGGFVDYENLKRKRVELRDLLQEFKDLNRDEYKSWPKEDKIAFWINAYNVQLLNIIIENYPIESDALTRFFLWHPDSVRYIDRKVGGIEKQKFNIMSEEFTLERIERRFLHEQFNEPKAFFTLFHGGRSGPPLLNKPYYGKTLYQQLDTQIKRTISNPKSFAIDTDKHTVFLQAILQPTSWYGNYFLDKYKTDKWFKDQTPEVRAVLNFLTGYLDEQQVEYLRLQNYTVKFYPYDWILNERK